MSYRTGIFTQREAERRALRDKTRNAFFAEFGLERLTDPFALDSRPDQQARKVDELIAIAKSKHGPESSGLELLEGQLKLLAFGLPVLSILRPNQVSLYGVMPEGMQKGHFDMTWAGWFDE